VMPTGALVSEEPDLEALFEAAVAEVSDQLDEEDFDVDYGFQAEFEDEEAGTENGEDGEDGEDEDDDDGVLVATLSLFDSINKYTGQEENIERFCLPLFAVIGAKYAVDHVLEAFRRRPAMAQIYSTYLARFISDDKIRQFLVDLLKDDFLVDWQ